MKERPIRFNTEMVRAVLDGVETQTRRVVKHQPIDYQRLLGLMVLASSENSYGKIGDRLWVREKFMYETEQGIKTGGVIYAATNNPEPDGDNKLTWKPSICMPRWASRITLEITDVRVNWLLVSLLSYGIQQMPNAGIRGMRIRGCGL